MNRSYLIVVGVLSSLFFLVQGHEFWSCIGLGLSVYYVLETINRIGQTIPIVHLMISMSMLQWVVGPFIEYHNSAHHYKYHMYVDETTYMSFIVPAILSFIAGAWIFRVDDRLEEIGERVTALLTRYPRIPYFFIGAGLLIPYLGFLIPASLGFVLYVLSNLKYVGVVYLLYSGKPNRWPVFMATMAFTAGASLATGMFHDLLLWSMMLSTFVARELKLLFNYKLIFAVLGLFLAITIQSVKGEYRVITGQGYGGNRFTLFMGLAVDQWTSGRIVNPIDDTDMNVRLNQGWIISAIMHHVPQKEPFAGGGTVSEAITSSLLPRFLAPDKKKAGGQENFERFTGLKLNQGTSMGISIVGEGWANYGYGGGIAFMFCWGMFIGWFWRKLVFYSSTYPTILLWSPILFLQVVKAETELVVVLNYLIKASVVVFGLLWFIKRQWGIRV
ncbi:MAG: hypothetical protein ACWA6U_09780 [Breznakibacter sp.]